MPYQMTWEEHGISVRYSGMTSDREVADFAKAGQADRRFDDLRYVLHDFRACEGATYSTPVIEELSATDEAAAASNPRIRIAVVTDRPDVRAMVEAYLKVGLSIFPLRMFSGIEEARNWLNAGIR